MVPVQFHLAACLQGDRHYQGTQPSPIFNLSKKTIVLQFILKINLITNSYQGENV